jgi:branched-chain amino acid aminotransferase
MTFDQVKWVWMNGEIVQWSKANIHVSTHALHYGTGIFEGVRCYDTPRGPAVFRLDEHLDRLFASAELHGVKMPYLHNELGAAVCQIIEANQFRSCYIRPIVFFGSGALSLDPRRCPVEVAILAWPWAPLLGQDSVERGVRVTVSPWRKFQSRMMPTTAKATGQYINSVLAVRDATERGYDEALLLNAEGGVAEGSGENLFVVRDGKVRTNDARHSVLMGITRDSVTVIARDLGYTVEEGELTLAELASADEAFFTGTAAEVTPIREVDGIVIGRGEPGEVTRNVQQAFFDAVSGQSLGYRKWLHFVDECWLSGAYSALPCI